MSEVQKPLLVRCLDRTVFQVDRKTLEPKTCGIYDAYCYSDPRVDVEYMEHAEWSRRHLDITMAMYRSRVGS